MDAAFLFAEKFAQRFQENPQRHGGFMIEIISRKFEPFYVSVGPVWTVGTVKDVIQQTKDIANITQRLYFNEKLLFNHQRLAHCGISAMSQLELRFALQMYVAYTCINS